jgi:hypothetical protein
MLGTAKPAYFSSVIPIEKDKKEQFIVEEFARMQSINGKPLSHIQICPDDSHGKPDIIAMLGETQVGIQVTGLIMEHIPASQSRLNRISRQLHKIILQKISIQIPILIDIHSKYDHDNQLLKLTSKKMNALANTIVQGISNNIFSLNPSDMFIGKYDEKRTSLSIPVILEDTIAAIFLIELKEKQIPYCFSYQNLSIHFNFTNVATDINIWEGEVLKIKENKAANKADILLIWSGDWVSYTNYDQIVYLFNKHLMELNNRYIYYFSFIGAEKFFDANKRIEIIKSI